MKIGDIDDIGKFNRIYDGINIDRILLNYNISENVLEYIITNFDINPVSISATQKLSIDFMEKHFDKLCKLTISAFQILNGDFIKKYTDSLEWDVLVKKQKLDIDILEDNLYRYNLYTASLGGNANIKVLVDKYPNKYEIDKLSFNI